MSNDNTLSGKREKLMLAVRDLFSDAECFAVLPIQDLEWILANTEAAVSLFADSIRQRIRESPVFVNIGQRQAQVLSRDSQYVPLFTTETGIAIYDYGDHFRCTLPLVDGMVGEELILQHLEARGNSISPRAKQILRLTQCRPHYTTWTEIAILKGAFLKDDERMTQNIYREARRLNLCKPSPGLTCRIGEIFTRTEMIQMELQYLAVMHEPVEDCFKNPQQLGIGYGGHGRFEICEDIPLLPHDSKTIPWISVCEDKIGDWWGLGFGFVFER